VSRLEGSWPAWDVGGQEPEWIRLQEGVKGWDIKLCMNWSDVHLCEEEERRMGVCESQRKEERLSSRRFQSKLIS